MFKVNTKDTRTNPNDTVAVSFGFNQTQKQAPEVFYRKAVLKQFAIFTGRHLCWSLFLIKLQDFRPANLSKETPAQYCNIFKNTNFEKNLPTAASVDCKNFYRATEN